MGDRGPIKTKHWESFLKNHGCSYLRTKSSHDHWLCPNCKRSIIFRGAKKEVPRFHIRTNLKSMGITMADFESWILDNC